MSSDSVGSVRPSDQTKRYSEREQTLRPADVHDILRNDRRRHTIRCLQRLEQECSVRELSERVAAVESGEEPPPRDRRHAVYVSLTQRHVPRLAEENVLTYDDQSKEVRLNHTLEEMLTCVCGRTQNASRDSQRTRSYLCAALVAGLLSLASAAGLRGFRRIHPAVWSVACALWIAGCETYGRDGP